MGIVGRLDQYASMLATEFNDYSMSENLVTYSEQFDNAAWTKSSVAITANTSATTAPDGTVTADKIQEDNTNNQHLVVQSIGTPSIGQVYTFSCWAKSAERTQMSLTAHGEGYSVFDLSTGTVSTTGGNSNVTITPYPNGWYRCSATITKTNTNGAFYIIVWNNGNPYTGTTGSGIYIWGAQVETGSVATGYTPTTTTAISRVLPATTNSNITGFGTYYSSGFDENTSITTLVQTGENLITYSEQFDNAAWSVGFIRTGITTNTSATTAPDGTNTAEKLREDTTASNSHYIARTFSGLTSTTSYTFSVFAKKEERSVIVIGSWDGVSGLDTTFDINSGTITYTPVGVTASITQYPNGWYRCVTTRTIAQTTVQPVIYLTQDGTTSYTGDGTSGIYIWGAQLERGSTATDYIPTTTTSVARSLPSSTLALSANVFAPYDPVYDEFSGTLFGAGQGRYMRQNNNKSVIVYDEIDEIRDFRDIVRTGLLLDLDAGMNSSYNGSGTTWTDLSGTGNNGTLVNTPTYNSSGYFDFDYAQFENVTFSSSSSLQFLNRSPYTLEAWVYPTINPGANNWTGIFDREDTSIGSRDGYNLYFLGSAGTDTTFSTERFVAGSAAAPSVTLNQSVSVNNWSHIVATYDGTTLSLYRNGSLVGTPATSTGNISNTSKTLTIGVRGGNYFGGRISNAKIYNKALTDNEITQNYNALKHRFGL
jgi:hypothetical protein